jgi:hypothetical protein
LFSVAKAGGRIAFALFTIRSTGDIFCSDVIATVVMSDHDVPAIRAFDGILEDMLKRGQSAKEMAMVEPPMSKVDIADLMEGFKNIFLQSSSLDMKRRSQYPIIETAVRDKFNRLVVCHQFQFAHTS